MARLEEIHQLLPTALAKLAQRMPPLHHSGLPNLIRERSEQVLWTFQRIELGLRASRGAPVDALPLQLSGQPDQPAFSIHQT